MEMNARYFPIPPLSASSTAESLPSLTLDSTIYRLANQCWAVYERVDDINDVALPQQTTVHHRQRQHRHSLYIGSLGPCAYLRYRLAKSMSWSEEKYQLLLDASKAVERVLSLYPMQPNMRVSLLEGERIGALALTAAIHSSLDSMQGHTSKLEVASSKSELLDIGTKIVQLLPESECEVLYGRAGYLHAIALVRSETGDVDFGRQLVERIVKSIIREGEKNAAAGTSSIIGGTSSSLSLLWTWHNKAYLGAIHGMAGILYTLLFFHEEVSTVKDASDKIKSSVRYLNEMCFVPSHNLRSSIGSERDELVHLCHGAPGHILLLLKTYQVFDELEFLERAKNIARSVLCHRGLLKKGVGLCHGISGNAYCFLSIYRHVKLSEERRKGKSYLSEEMVRSECREWLRWAHHFAMFGVENIERLYSIPDHPYSLYEGMSGLIMLLHDLRNPDNSYFPCFEHGT